MTQRGKKYEAVRGKLDRQKRYPVSQAVRLVKESSYAKFDESVDAAVKLGVNPKYADQMVRGAVSLPHGIGKSVRVAVFVKGEKEKEAREAGADFVGGDELVQKVQEGWTAFDKAIATPDMMGAVGRLGKILGPRGLMPNPKSGTVTMDVARAVRETKAGRIEFRVDKAGIVHAPIGKVSFDAEKLQDNLISLLETLWRAKPSTAKGTYMQSVTISSTMGPGIRIDPAEVSSLGRAT